MRKSSLVFVSVLLISLSSVFAKGDNRLELNKENLTLLALNHSSTETIKQFVVRLAKDKDIRAYYKAKKDEKNYKALLDAVNAELQAKMNTVGSSVHFVISQKVTIKSIDESTGEVKISNFLKRPFQTISTGHGKIKGLPAYYFLLYANAGLTEKLKIAKKLKEISKNSKITHLFLEATLKLEKFQNQQEFQVMIEKIDLYRDKSKKELLASVTESRNYKIVTNNWFLSEGFTNKLIGIHSFDVYGYRIQDMMTEIKTHQNICKKTKHIGKHQVIECKKNLSKSSYLAISYVGGLLSQLNIMTSSEISVKEYNQIIYRLSNSLRKPKLFFNEGMKNWQKFSVDFYFFPLDLSKKVSKDRLVFTMMSAATKKLINENTGK